MSWDNRPQVGESFDWLSADETDRLSVHVIAADHIHNIYTAVAKHYDNTLQKYGESELTIFRVQPNGSYTTLTIDGDDEG